jgi:hypothetical protein
MNFGKWLDKVGDSFAIAISRYPITFGIFFCLCFYLSTTVSNSMNFKETAFVGILIAGICSILFYHVAEIFSFNGIKKQGLASISLLVGLFIFWLFNNVFIADVDWRGNVFAVMMFIIVLVYLLIPLVQDKEHKLLQRSFVIFLENLAESLSLGLIFYIVLISAIRAVDMLFDAGLNDLNLYSHLAIWISGLFLPLNFLSNTPSLSLNQNQLPKYNSRFFKILILYVGIPIALVYGAIIIAYVIKFIFTGQTKEWTLSMFIWFLALGLVVYIMNKVFIEDNKNDFAELFNRYFPTLGVILSSSSLLICYVSIQKIGLTTSYYFASLFSITALFIFGMMIYKKSLNAKILYGSLALASLFSIISGPFDCYEAPLKSQKARLFSFLEANERYDKDGFKKNTKSVDQVELATITSGANTVSLEAFNKMIKDVDQGRFIKDSTYIGPNELFQKLGIEYTTAKNINDPQTYKNQIHDNLPSITFEKGDVYIPVTNSYGLIPDGYNGAKITYEGGLHIYSNGVNADSISIDARQLGPQRIELRSSVKNQFYDLYVLNLNYETLNNKIIIRDLNGVLIKKIK